jgi:hypothetical protein
MNAMEKGNVLIRDEVYSLCFFSKSVRILSVCGRVLGGRRVQAAAPRRPAQGQHYPSIMK